jgi:DNA-binding response OmpR family regulator
MKDRKPIMVVEDDANIRQLIAAILRDAGHKVVECGSGEEALSAMETVSPRLVTLDLAMPSMDGLHFLDLLKDRGDGTKVPVLVITAAPEPLRIELILEGYDILAKPFHLDDLLAAVEQALDRRAVA